ncbi:xanthine dehydrogenase family protein molybdopterin-binding subunit [Candidatus Poriferisodalis sp.]|uniref:xanthine dehydrogenase family protein molybdopterin-binding subunit n=1 Tax=Candidatus Poriferisodalis sp. TaxID=3101277 RepID=UPI003B51D2F5
MREGAAPGTPGAAIELEMAPPTAGGLGESPPRADGPAKVSGLAGYPADRVPADALWAFAVFTDQPHARLRRLDLGGAERSPGVVAVLGSADVPCNEYGLTKFDQPVFVGLDHTGRSQVPCDVSRWEADHLALIVAESLSEARTAAAVIDVDWEPLPIVADLDAALAPDAPLVHPYDGIGSNLYESMRTLKGDLDAGFAAASAVVEATYEVPYQEHAYLQPEAGTSWVDAEGIVNVEIAGQWVHEDREQIAHALDLAEERIRVRYPAIGGAFGGREDTSMQIVLALAATRLAEQGIHRPVAMQWSREESIVGHHKRHRGRIWARWGANRDGKITAAQAEAWLDAGAYNYTSNKVMGNLHLGLGGPYELPNAAIDTHVVYTNATPGGAFRGFGAPQAAFAVECQVNKLAEALGMDPIDIRRVNTLREGSLSIAHTPMPAGVTMPEVIEACASAAAQSLAAPAEVGAGCADVDGDDASSAPCAARPDGPAADEPALFSPFGSLPPKPSSLRRGSGFACAFKNVGFSFGFPERCEATIVLHGEPSDDIPTSVELAHAGADVGQGAHTAFLQMAAEATGVDPARVVGRFSDTGTSGDSGSASASRLTWMAGNSILGAAEEAEKAWREGDRPATGHFRFTPPPTTELDPETGEGTPNFTYGYVAQHIELTVDIDTGHIRIDRVISANDVGRAINPRFVVGQIEGAVAQAHGHVLSEHLRSREGRLLNPRFSTYLIPGIGDIPVTTQSVVLELADPLGPFGARGMAEMGVIPYAPAVAAALADATGVWMDDFPLTPERVWTALRGAGVTR